MTVAPTTPRRRSWIAWLIAAVLLIGIGLLLFLPGVIGTPSTPLTYSAFVTDVQARKVADITIDAEG